MAYLPHERAKVISAICWNLSYLLRGLIVLYSVPVRFIVLRHIFGTYGIAAPPKATTCASLSCCTLNITMHAKRNMAHIQRRSDAAALLGSCSKSHWPPVGDMSVHTV